MFIFLRTIELGNNDTETLWNLADDPTQQEDLAGKMPELLSSMREEFEKLKK